MLQTRRHFLKTTTLSATAALSRPSLGAAANKNSNLRILQIGVGGIGQLDRKELATHPKVEFAGFCDVDGAWLEKYSAPYPKAFKLKDYREAFEGRGDQFDAVVVDTPDFHHAPMILTALEHGKHVYGQKPLVQQLDELRVVREALPRRPNLVTQMGNQRAGVEGRIQAVEILKNDQLGKPLEAHVWTGKMQRDSHMGAPWAELPEPQPIPDYFDWDLWHGPLVTKLPFSEEIVPRRWRSWWETGTGMLGDWGCHLIDVLYYAYDLPSPESVMTHTPRPSGHAHSGQNRSVITYPGGGRFGRDKFVLYYNDDEARPSFEALGLPPVKHGFNQTLIVCEEGALLLGDLGQIDVFRGGKRVDEPLPEVAPSSHWHDWVDCCLGTKNFHWSPFEMALRITEAPLLAVKATRFPNTELAWDGAKACFTNHDRANKECVKRAYRQGFELPEIG